jgi:hypothetical protein
MTQDAMTLWTALGVILVLMGLGWQVITWGLQRRAEKGNLELLIRQGSSHTIGHPCVVYADIVAVNHGSTPVYVTAAAARLSPFKYFPGNRYFFGEWFSNPFVIAPKQQATLGRLQGWHFLRARHIAAYDTLRRRYTLSHRDFWTALLKTRKLITKGHPLWDARALMPSRPWFRRKPH